MADRQVTHTGKDSNGDITALCYPGAWWSPRSKEDAIEDINSGVHTYYVQWSEDERTEIRVVNAERPYLRTDRDNTTANNLADLPDC